MTEADQAYATSVQAGRRVGARSLAVPIILGLAIAGGGARSSEATPVSAAALGDCAPYTDPARDTNHELEVCTAYMGNSAEVALQGIYKFGNNRASYLADGAKHHFETRYYAGPRQAVEKRVRSWPKTSSFTGNRVAEDVDLVSLSSNLQADRAVLKTRESWKVTSPDGKVLYREPRHNRDITMCRGRLAGHPLHEWFVVSYLRKPKYDCIGFDKHHGIKP